MRLLVILLMLLPFVSQSQVEVSNQNSADHFSMVEGSATASILYDDADDILIKKAADFLASDIEKVTGKKPIVLTSNDRKNDNLIIIGSIGNSPIIDRLIRRKKIDVKAIKGGWERFIIQTVKNPMRGVKEALVIIGSDKRGAAYGTFSVSKEITNNLIYFCLMSMFLECNFHSI